MSGIVAIAPNDFAAAPRRPHDDSGKVFTHAPQRTIQQT
jgi:hypothetical protein